MDSDRIEHPSWFNTKMLESYLYLTTEDYYYAGNRSNIWLIRGTNRDILIDSGLGVCNLKKHLEKLDLLDSNRECIVVCTHSHFDHSGGAHHFDNVLIHQDDYDGLSNGEKSATLNWSHSSHYRAQPYPSFSPDEYKVPPTKCTPITNGHQINLGDDDDDKIEIIHVPGHTPGSIVCYYPKKKALFTGDFVYKCSNGSCLFDWAPTSSTNDYLRSANYMLEWFNKHEVENIYPGHYGLMNEKEVQKLLKEYINSKEELNILSSSSSPS